MEPELFVKLAAEAVQVIPNNLKMFGLPRTSSECSVFIVPKKVNDDSIDNPINNISIQNLSYMMTKII